MSIRSPAEGQPLGQTQPPRVSACNKFAFVKKALSSLFGWMAAQPPVPAATIATQEAPAAAAVAAAALVPRDWSALRDEYIARVKRNPFSLEETTKELVSSQAPAELLRKVTLEAVKRRGWALEYASPELRADREIVLEAVKQYGLALKFASPGLRADSVIVLEAVKQNGHALHYADPELRKDPVIVLAAVEQAGDALQHAHPLLRKDPVIVLAAVKQYGLALRHAHPLLRKDPVIVLAAVEQNGIARSFAAPELKADPGFMLVAVKQNGWALLWADPLLREDRGFILEAVKQNGLALEYASPELRADREIQLVAARKTWQEMQCMSDAAGTTQAVSQKAPSAESKGCILIEAGGFFAQIPQWEFESEDPNFGAVGFQAIELIMQSDAVRALFREAFEASRASRPFKFKLVKDLPFGGSWTPNLRTIHLRDNLLTDPARFISTLIFELTNATRSACFQEAYERACLRDISKEDFAKRYEEIEYENAKTHLDVCKNALCELRWPCAFVEQIEKIHPQTKQDFPTYWAWWKHGAHTEFYRQNYDRITPEDTEHVKAIRSSRQQFADRFLSGTFSEWENRFIPDDYHTEVLQKAYDSQYPDSGASRDPSVPSFEEFARSKRQEALPAILSRLAKLQW